MRAILELDHDHRRLSRHRLSRPQKEGHTLPPLTVNKEPGRYEGLRFRIRSYLHLLPVTDTRLPLYLPLRILPPDHILEHLIRRHQPDMLQHPHLAVTDRFGLIGFRTIHRDHAQQLQQVVLDHVPQRPTAVIIPATLSHAHLLRHADLDMIDKIPVPQRLEDMIRKPKGREILYHLLSQVMIDMIDLPLLEPPGQIPVELFGGFEIGPEWFFHDNPVMR